MSPVSASVHHVRAPPGMSFLPLTPRLCLAAVSPPSPCWFSPFLFSPLHHFPLSLSDLPPQIRPFCLVHNPVPSAPPSFPSLLLLGAVLVPEPLFCVPGPLGCSRLCPSINTSGSPEENASLRRLVSAVPGRALTVPRSRAQRRESLLRSPCPPARTL